jgi:hypothetical protein
MAFFRAAGDGAVVLGRAQLQGVGAGDRLAQRGGLRRDAALDVDVLVVEGHSAQAFVDKQLDTFGSELGGGLGELAVVRAGAQGADEGDYADGHGYSCCELVARLTAIG